MKIAIVVSHPIQHFCPMYASWAKNPNTQLKVFFASNLGVKAYQDVNFDKEIKWGNLYLDEFNHVFLNNARTLKIEKKLDAPMLEFELNQFQPDFVIQYGYYYKLNQRLRKWAFKNKVKVGYISDSENRHKENILKRAVKQIVLPIYFKKIDVFLSVGDANEEYYKSLGVKRQNLLRMNFSINIKVFDEKFLLKETLRANLRSDLKIGADDLVISVVGKLVKWKNQIDLVNLLLLLENESNWPRVHLIIAGSGPCENEIMIKAKGLSRHRVHYLGFIDPDKLPEVYSATDIYIHPSEYEPHSLAVSEAIYMGLPVIVSHTSGSYGDTDDVRIGQNGYVFKLGDLHDLKSQILKLLNPEARKEHSECSVEISRAAQQNAHYEVLNNLLKSTL
jgi:glycosyltransferase involved in cell wall biosynthesis